jgi:hypothetical protein
MLHWFCRVRSAHRLLLLAVHRMHPTDNCPPVFAPDRIWMVIPHLLFVGFRLLAPGVSFIVGLSPLTATLLLFERGIRGRIGFL